MSELGEIIYPQEFSNEDFVSPDCSITKSKNNETEIVTTVINLPSPLELNQFNQKKPKNSKKGVESDPTHLNILTDEGKRAFDIAHCEKRCRKYYAENQKRIISQLDNLQKYLLKQGNEPNSSEMREPNSSEMRELLCYHALCQIKSTGDTSYLAAQKILQACNPDKLVTMGGSDYAACLWSVIYSDLEYSNTVLLFPIGNGSISIVSGYENILAVNAFIFMDKYEKYKRNARVPAWILYIADEVNISSMCGLNPALELLVKNNATLESIVKSRRLNELVMEGNQNAINLKKEVIFLKKLLGSLTENLSNPKADKRLETIKRILEIFKKTVESSLEYARILKKDIGKEKYPSLLELQIFISKNLKLYNLLKQKGEITHQQALGSLSENDFNKPGPDVLRSYNFVKFSDVSRNCRDLCRDYNKNHNNFLNEKANVLLWSAIKGDISDIFVLEDENSSQLSDLSMKNSSYNSQSDPDSDSDSVKTGISFLDNYQNKSWPIGAKEVNSAKMENSDEEVNSGKKKLIEEVLDNLRHLIPELKKGTTTADIIIYVKGYFNEFLWSDAARSAGITAGDIVGEICSITGKLVLELNKATENYVDYCLGLPLGVGGARKSRKQKGKRFTKRRKMVKQRNLRITKKSHRKKHKTIKRRRR